MPAVRVRGSDAAWRSKSITQQTVCIHQVEEPHPALNVINEARDQDKGVFLRADLCQPPALPHGDAVVGGVIAQPCNTSICLGSTSWKYLEDMRRVRGIAWHGLQMIPCNCITQQ